MRVAALLLLAAAGSAEARMAGRVTEAGCPLSCKSTIDLAFAPPADAAGRAGRLFLGVFATTDGEIQYGAGGYWTGKEWTVSATPLSFHAGSLRAARLRVDVPGGICGQAKQAGAPPGRYVVVGGFGVDRVDLTQHNEDLERLRAVVADGVATPELVKLLADYEAALQRQAAAASNGATAIVDMMKRDSRYVLGEVTCG